MVYLRRSLEKACKLNNELQFNMVESICRKRLTGEAAVAIYLWLCADENLMKCTIKTPSLEAIKNRI